MLSQATIEACCNHLYGDCSVVWTELISPKSYRRQVISRKNEQKYIERFTCSIRFQYQSEMLPLT